MFLLRHLTFTSNLLSFFLFMKKILLLLKFISILFVSIGAYIIISHHPICILH